MGKSADDIIKWGVVKPFFDKTYRFNSIDIETIDNEIFMLGYTLQDHYFYTLDNFYNVFHSLLIESTQTKHDILTWTRYDNTFLLKMILANVENVNEILLRIGKISPIYSYTFKTFTIVIQSIIKDSIVFKIIDKNDDSRTCIVYNFKNLFMEDLESTAKDYKIDWYSKMGKEYHVIDKNRFYSDMAYQNNVIRSNELDNRVLPAIAYKLLDNFKTITGVYPKSIFTAGSIARSYLLAYNKIKKIPLNFRGIFNPSGKRDTLIDYSMRAYHGGKIESYVLGSIKKGFIVDLTSAYPSVLAKLPLLTGKIHKYKGSTGLEQFFYAFIHCDIYVKNSKLIHPIIVENPLNHSNISPWGCIENVVITKPEYDYMLKKGCEITVYDYIGCEHKNEFPYETLVNDLFEKRLIAKNQKNPALEQLYKTILNSLYGITYELTDLYEEIDNHINWIGYRAGDYFNPIIASYITGTTRTILSETSHNVIENGGEVFLNMTDSIIFDGQITLDVFSEQKRLGTFEPPEPIKNIMILGAGRYEYQNEFDKKWIIKSRGFEVKVKDKSFYSKLSLSEKTSIDHQTFVTSFKATTKKYDYKQMGHLIDDSYDINPFNLGGKRYLLQKDFDIKSNYVKTYPIELEKGLFNT